MSTERETRQRIEAYVHEILSDSHLDRGLRQEAREDFVEHLVQASEELSRSGLTPDDAVDEAIRRFGDTAEVRARLAAHGASSAPPLRPAARPGIGDVLRSAMRDVVLAGRTAGRRPLVPAIVVLTVAIGIAAATTVYSVVEKVLVESPPFPAPDRLLVLIDEEERFDVMSPGNFMDLRAQTTRSFDGLAAYGQTTVVAGIDAEVERVGARFVSSEFFSTLGIQPQLGVGFARDHERGGSNVAVVSHEFWTRTLGGRPGIVGTSILVNEAPTEVIGVMPPGFRLHGPIDVWLPLTLVEGEASRGSHFLFVIGRLAPDTEIAAAAADLDVAAARLHADYPRFFGDGGLTARTLHDAVVAGVAPRLRLLAAAVLLVLVLVCANVANLLLTRAEERRPEYALRLSLGASRQRIGRLIAVDTLLFTSVGAVVGLLLASQIVATVAAIAPAGLPRADELRMDLSVTTAGLATALGSALVICSAVLWSVLRRDSLLGSLSNRFSQSRDRRRFRDAIVVAQVAGSMVLMVHAGLLAQSFLSLQAIDPGLNADRLFTAQIALSGDRFGSSEDRWLYFDEAARRLEELPGVEAATVGSFRPTSGGFTRRFALSDRPPPPDDAYMFATYDPVAPGYFETLQVPHVAGRTFEYLDAADARPVAVVNEAFVEAFFPSSDPLGVWLGYYSNGMPRTDELEIVGVVGDIRSDAISSEARPAVYLPLSLSPMVSGTFFIRHADDAPGLANRVRESLHELDPSQPAHSLRPMTEVFASSIERDRLLALMLVAFALVAFFLALSGVFGLTAHAVGRRTREFGLRIALGAEPGGIVASTLRAGLATVTIGLAIGWAASMAGAELVRESLFQIEPFDLPTYLGVSVCLAFVSLLAVALPARRASSIHPLEALRSE